MIFADVSDGRLPGQPATDPARIVLELSQAELKQLDFWISQHANQPTRAQGVRELVARALAQGLPPVR